MIRVLLADDESDVLNLWRRLLQAQADFDVVGIHLDAPHLSSAIVERLPDIALVDLGMFGPNAVDAVGRLVDAHRDVRFVVYSGRSEPQTIAAAFDVGVWGFIDKLCTPASMFEALRRIAAGEVVFPPDFSLDRDDLRM
ncbi:MAG: response regulator transcription factor [Phycisphaerae bacterium]|nr:response regulator transcription factor [Phycisphaerae bacterium]